MLSNGSQGDEVKELQRALLEERINPGAVDGVFGPKTEAAVRVFQERMGLQVDGIAGPKTMAALEKVAGEGEEKPEIDPRQLGAQ